MEVFLLRNIARGFTLIEVLITLALLTVIAGLGLFVSMGTFHRTSASEERDALVALLTRARTHSITNYGGTAHGVCSDGLNYVAFAVPYSESNREEIIPASSAITVSGIPVCGSGDEIIFTQLTATTSPVSITLADNLSTSTIEVNEEGGIMW